MGQAQETMLASLTVPHIGLLEQEDSNRAVRVHQQTIYLGDSEVSRGREAAALECRWCLDTPTSE